MQQDQSLSMGWNVPHTRGQGSKQNAASTMDEKGHKWKQGLGFEPHYAHVTSPCYFLRISCLFLNWELADTLFPFLSNTLKPLHVMSLECKKKHLHLDTIIYLKNISTFTYPCSTMGSYIWPWLSITYPWQSMRVWSSHTQGKDIVHLLFYI